MDADQLLARGMERLESHKWQDAIQALEAFVFQYPTHARYQEARYRLAEAYYGKGEYISAATEFGRLANDFPTGTWADDSRYQVCDSYAHLSPKPQLDQEYTQEAIDHCQSLLAYFPDSEFAERGREILTQLTNKLAQKIFLNGEHYFKRNAFDSAETGSFPAWLVGESHRTRGEFVLLVHPKAADTAQEGEIDASVLRTLALLMGELPLKTAVRLCAEITGEPRNALYEAALALRKQGGSDEGG
jgi:tetratricopeptide (TPR) repeat protein